MQRYILIRVSLALLALWGVLTIVFVLVRLSGSPVDLLVPPDASPESVKLAIQKWGLEKPWHIQYVAYLGNLARADFGTSLVWSGQDALGVVLSRVPATLQLAGLAFLISTAVAVPVGVFSAVKKNTALDAAAKVVAMLGQSVPAFWLAIVLVWVFAVELRWLPTSGRGTIGHMVLPAISLGAFSMASFMRMTRSSMIETLGSEFIKFARIRGLPDRKIYWKHALKNAAIPPLTLLGSIVGIMVTGAIAIETVFAWPGVGLLARQALLTRDYPVVQAVVIVTSSMIIFLNLLVDILYVYLDPRVRYT